MFTFCERDSHRMPVPARTHLPLKIDPPKGTKEEQEKKDLMGSGTIFDDNDPKESEV